MPRMLRLLVVPALLLTVLGITAGLAVTSNGTSSASDSTPLLQLYSGPIGAGPDHQVQLMTGPIGTSTAPNTGTLAWRTVCIHQFGFCAEFPYVVGSAHWFEHHTDYTSATSVSGHLVNYTSNLYIADNGRGYCLGMFTHGCNPEGRHNQYYFVEIIHSKYADPWQALSAINGGVGPHPVFIRVHGHLTCTFKGIYGGHGISVWAHNRVYYLESGNLTLKGNPPAIVDRFLRSIRFIPVSR